MTEVHVVVPEGIDDPARPSGGNAYDRQICRALGSLGWSVHEHTVRGGWPRPDASAFAALGAAVRRIPDGGVVLLDGLIASTAPQVIVPETGRLSFVVLVHMPLGDRPAGDMAEDTRMRERAVLSAVAAVLTTSAWSRQRLLELYQLVDDRVHTARPGVEAAELATGTEVGSALLCVAAVTFEKGHDILLDALRSVDGLRWDCVCLGSLDRDPQFAETIRRGALEAGLGDRIHLHGPRTGADLDRAYAAADLILLASRAESYGMVLTEALARGVPVVATDVGGVGEAIGCGADSVRPGLLVPPEDPAAFGTALRSWLVDAELRRRLRRAAQERRESLCGWSSTASVVAAVLAAVAR